MTIHMKRYSKGSVKPYRSKSMSGPRWRGYLKEGTIVDASDGRGHVVQETHWKTISKVFSDVPCRDLGNGRYRGVREAEAALSTWRASLEEAAQAEYDKALENGLGRRAGVPEMLIPDFLDQYIDLLVESGGVDGPIERSTEEVYRYSARFSKRYFADVRVGELTPAALVEWKRHLNGSTVSTDRHRPLSNTTKKKAFNILKRAYGHACKVGEIRESPFDGVASYKPTPPSPNPLDKASYKRLRKELKRLPADPFPTAVWLAVRTGMRIGEVCGLRWRDVDLSTGEIVVSTTIARHGGSRTYEKAPKGRRTSNNIRRIPGSPKIRSILKARRKQVRRECEELGVTFTPDLFVIGDIDGNYMNPANLTRKWRAYADGCRLRSISGERVTFHDLRHTFATKAIGAGVDPIVVARILGHRDPSITMTVYADALKESKDTAMRQLDVEF